LLRQFAPFQDAPPRGPCLFATPYVAGMTLTEVLQPANANALLNAEALATALNIYFSDPALGGNKISCTRSNRRGSNRLDEGLRVSIDDSCSAYEDASGAFGGSTTTPILEMLICAASQTTVGGYTWYAIAGTTEKLAIDAFRAINQQVGFTP
jgi:hypothetical protein